MKWQELPKATEKEQECGCSCSTCMFCTWNMQSAPDGYKDRCAFHWEGEKG